MNRSAVIATVVATTGVLVAGSIASVAVINAASSSESTKSGITLVADATEPSAPATGESPLGPSEVAPSTSGLPALPIVPEAPADDPATGAPDDDPADDPADAGPRDDAPADDDSAPQDDSVTTVAYTVSSSQAARTVLAESGGSVLSVSKATRGGYQAWAVKVKRPDGSIVTGYVDRASGVLYDWVVNQQAPARPANGDDDSDDEAEEHEDEGDHDESDHDEDESDEDHDDESEYEGDDD